MKEQKKHICKRVDRVVDELNGYIDDLYAAPCFYSRYMTLCQLKSKIQELRSLNSMMCDEENRVPLKRQQDLSRQRTFTLEELAKYNGKDGKPAYVAVNGTVYDATNNAAWAAASHFGLSAGKDLTSEFASCHANQEKLDKLNVVGTLAS